MFCVEISFTHKTCLTILPSSLDIPAAAVGTTDGGEANGDATKSTTDVVPYQSHPTSYAAIHLQLHKKNKMYIEKYTEHILNYATEWERILTTRISGHLKQSEKLRVDLDHYAKKVEDLNKTMNKTMSKGKNVDDKGVDKLKRNEQKLVQARAEYDRFVNDLCGFMEEVMDRGWKDLHPLLVKMAQFDSTLSNEETLLLKGSMMDVTEQMKSMATKYPNLKPQGRLKELETFSLESLAKVNPSMKNDGPLMITHGAGEAAAYVAPLGGGDPNALGNSQSIHAGVGNSSDQLNYVGGGGGLFGSVSRTSSFASGNGSDTGGPFGQQPLSRNNSGVNIGGGSGTDGYDWSTGRVSAPSSGGLPPLNPSNRTGSFNEPPPMLNRTSAGHSDLSQTSLMLSTMQAAAPPPTLQDVFNSNSPARPAASNTNSMMTQPPPNMHPPPPSMPPPPPPQSPPNMSTLSMYDNSPQMTQHNQMVPLQQTSHQQTMNQYSAFSSQTSTASSTNTNPFDDAFGPPPTANTPGQQQPSQSQYGGNVYGGGGSSTNPFG